MIVMPANNTGSKLRALAARYPGRIGHIYSPKGFRTDRDQWTLYALDNGRFKSTTEGVPWDERQFLKMCERAAECGVFPQWVVVPDVVGDADGTRREWDRWAPRLEQFGFTLAMAAQDGMSPADIPEDVVCFLGGTTGWKRRSIWRFCDECERVHVGRVNTERWLWECDRAGAESVDGTGWYHHKQFAQLERYMRESARGEYPLLLFE